MEYNLMTLTLIFELQYFQCHYKLLLSMGLDLGRVQLDSYLDFIFFYWIQTWNQIHRVYKF